MDHGHGERYYLHNAKIVKAIRLSMKRKKDGWPYASSVYEVYLSSPLPHPYKHLSYRQFNKRLKDLAEQDLIDRYIVPLGRHGVRSIVRLKEDK